MNPRHLSLPRLRINILLSLSLAFLAGCRHSSSATSAPTPTGGPPQPSILVTYTPSQERKFTPFEEFTGHIEARESVQVRARVSGYLDKIRFDDGAEVQEGQELFELDKDIFEAEKAKAKGSLLQVKSRLKRINSQYDRAKALVMTNAITTDEFERIESDKIEADAALTVAQATLDLAELDCKFATVKAPLSGRISRRAVDEGNLIKADDTILATVVMVDSVYAVFEIDERTAIRIKKNSLKESGQAVPLADQAIKEVDLFLIDEAQAQLEGTIDFNDNELDPNTGTLRVRAIVKNKNLLLSPGFFVRCRLWLEDKKKSPQRVWVPEESLASDQGQRFLYVYKGGTSVERRDVKIGALLDGWRVIEKNLAADEQVIVSGLQRVRPGDQNEKVKFERDPKYVAANSTADKPTSLSHQAARPTSKAAPE